MNSYPCPEYYQPIGSVSCGQSRKWVEGIAKLGDGSQDLLRAQYQVCVSQQEAASSLTSHTRFLSYYILLLLGRCQELSLWKQNAGPQRPVYVQDRVLRERSQGRAKQG